MSDENCCGACGYPIHATKDKACDWCRQSADRIEALTAELAKAVEALREIAGECGCSTARAIIAEIEGSNAP
jgi:hypothetical protein